MPALEAIAFASRHPLAAQARRAIERLAGPQAEVLTLVRASQEETMPEELLRPARSTSNSLSTDERDTLLHVSDKTVLTVEAQGINSPGCDNEFRRGGINAHFQAKEITILREYVEDTLDWLTALCGAPGRERAPRELRAAIRHLDSPLPTLRARAEERIRRAHPRHATPLLYGAARSRIPLRAVRAVGLLARMGDPAGRELLHHLVSEPLFRNGEQRETLRRTARSLLTPEGYARQAAESLAYVEQRPESCRAIARFRQATEILRFLRAPLSPEILDRALVVRAVGGENLSLARQALRDTQGVDVEHVCLVRREAVLMLLHLPNREFALQRLMQTAAYPNPAVQLTALHGLADLNDPRGVNALLPIAQDERSPIREDAQELLALLGTSASGALTLLRASERQEDAPHSLLRPMRPGMERPDTLLRSIPSPQYPRADQIAQEIEGCAGE